MSLMCSVGKIPLCGTFPRFPALCLVKTVFTAQRRPGPPASQRGCKPPLQRWLGPLGQPRGRTSPRPQRIGVSPPSAREMCISRVLAERTMGWREPEKGLTYGHCKRKDEQLKKKEKKRNK